jgi:hypothetical protein
MMVNKTVNHEQNLNWEHLEFAKRLLLKILIFLDTFSNHLPAPHHCGFETQQGLLDPFYPFMPEIMQSRTPARGLHQ